MDLQFLSETSGGFFGVALNSLWVMGDAEEEAGEAKSIGDDDDDG